MSKLTQYTDVTVIFDIDGQHADAELSHVETLALAQFFKRLSWREVRGCAVNDDEAHLICAAVAKLQGWVGLRWLCTTLILIKVQLVFRCSMVRVEIP